MNKTLPGEVGGVSKCRCYFRWIEKFNYKGASNARMSKRFEHLFAGESSTNTG